MHSPQVVPLQAAFLAAQAGSAWRFAQALFDPEAAQRRLLAAHLKRCAATDFGRAHGFSRLSSVEAWQAQIPISDYEALAPWVMRLMQGDEGVLCPDPVLAFEESSGTASTVKRLPLTAGLLAQFAEATGPWLIDLHRRFPRRQLFLPLAGPKAPRRHAGRAPHWAAR